MATLMVHLRYGGGAFEGRIDPTKRWKLSIHFFLLSAVQATSCISTLLLAIMEGDETETLGKLFCFLGEVGQQNIKYLESSIQIVRYLFYPSDIMDVEKMSTFDV